MRRLRVLGCVIAASYCCLLLLVTAQVTDPSEVKALRAVKSRLIDPNNYLRNWHKGDPCTSNWTKVVCSNKTGNDGYLHVTELQLLDVNLSGNLAPELGQLYHLWIIDFMWNGLTGTIPKEIGKLSSLTLLLLNGNKLSGSLPDELGYLSKLNRLQVDQNQMSGPIPKSFTNLVSVKHLHMNNNSFSGQIPSELSKLPILLHLLLDNNNLSGHLPPELSNLTELRIFQLDNNNFSESDIPATYGNFYSLAKLSLRNCRLQGFVPDLSKIANLSYLDLSRNHLIGPIPSQELSDSMTTIDLSYNNLNGSIPSTFLDLPHLQKLDLRNNSLSDSSGDLDPGANVSLRLENNPICKNASQQNIGQFCTSSAEKNEIPEKSKDPTETSCPIQSCPFDNFYEYVPTSSVRCYCAAPIRIGYRLKSPSFSYFRPYYNEFKVYLTRSLKLDVSQLSIDSFFWESGPRLRMYLKLFPMFNSSHSNTFNTSEVQRIRRIFISWEFPRTDFFGPYELLNFTLLGPYSDVIITNAEGSGISKGILAAIVLGAIACVFTISAIVLLLISRHKYQQAPSRRRQSSTISIKIDGVKAFSFKEMATATGNFDSSTQVGRGGYGKVYKGILGDDTIVAIKRAEEGSLQGQKEFLTEIELLSRVHHRNLVSLIGYCDEEEEQMLVYEFMPNGTLRDWLSAKAERTLNFSMRLSIALGSAKGILYLHTEAEPPIFHRDIKATNILLDSHLTAKVADFGLSRLAPLLDAEGTVPEYVSTVVKGTPGYLDPEYFLTRKLTDKSDVYSLGVVFLELLTGMHPISHGKNIVREVMTANHSGTMFSVIDSRMGSYPSECLERFAALALSCCDEKTERRPSMLAVVRELEDILKMMPESDTVVSESTSTFSGLSTTQSSSFMASSSLVSSSMSGSDLVSGVIPTITPR
ncbi:probable LRR receptor-like serine/threonine-protein kinase At1g06840 isoform X1 [Morus notabilis]|uniref:probable LRR receptor-like serine/threonine-protein kinase At1g06840 isoform X1 n=1 Tax=Morus notabilis TaxID=981085 RepID=UPI000CECF09A|nr:probable LRR receptor-like serine/threonine-protein kinase At1g06840 isoform X1 [Morus notabilis]